MLQLPLSNIPEYAWICPYNQDSEYTLGPNYAKILNMAKFWIWQSSEYGRVLYMRVLHSFLNMPEYALSFEYILDFKHARILNMAGFWIARVTQSSKYVLIRHEYAWLCLNLW